MISNSSKPLLKANTGGVQLPEGTNIVSDTLTFDQKSPTYMFYDAIKTKKAPNAYRKLLSYAKKSIKIWDPFFMPDYCAQLFKDVRVEGIDIEILSSYKGIQDKDDMERMLTNIREVLEANSVSSATIAACIHNYAKWHDRFLIIDEGLASQTVYLVGASMDDQIQSNKSHGIGKVANKQDEDLIIEKYTDCRRKCPCDEDHKMSRNLPYKH